jgi:histone H3/H4
MSHISGEMMEQITKDYVERSMRKALTEWQLKNAVNEKRKIDASIDLLVNTYLRRVVEHIQKDLGKTLTHPERDIVEEVLTDVILKLGQKQEHGI